MPLVEMPPGRLLEYVDLYNVRWILTATPEAAAYIDKLPYVRAFWSSQHFTLYGVTAPYLGFASERGVAIRASYDLLQVTIAPGVGQAIPKTIVLKYHWDPGLEVAAPCTISPVKQLEDPVPLILLEPNGETDIRITFH
jgi:hypothetical protein